MSGSKKKSPAIAGNLENDDRSSSIKQSEFKSKTEDEDDDRPAWSELKTKAGKERKRLPLACIACRRKKIRCSGEKPACKHCSKARIPCVYKVTLRKPAPRTDYMAMLDRRLKRMEDRVIKLSPEHGASKLAAIGRSTVKPYVPPAPKAATTRKRVAEEELNDWANENSNLQFGSGSLTNNPGQLSLIQEGSEVLPPQDIQEHLSEVFFDYLYGQSYHVLHKPSFMRKLKSGKVPPVLILTICALSARFSTHPQVSTEPAFLRGEEWAKTARSISLRRYDEPSITILIVYLLLGLHEFGTCQGGRSWMFGGMALRMAYALQLHHELDQDAKGNKNSTASELSYTDREIRRRTMWACFLMDRFNSSGTDRPVFAFEENINVQLPIQEFKFQMEIPGQTQDIDGNVPSAIRDDPEQVQDAKDNMGLAAYIVKVVSLWGKVVKYVNLGRQTKKKQSLMWEKDSDFNTLKRHLKEFVDGLPESLQYTPDTLENHAATNQANQLIFLHIIASQIMLFLHKFAIPANPGIKLVTDAPKEFIAQSTRNAVEAANRIAMLLKDATEYHVSAPFVGYCAFAASTVHIWCIFSSNTSVEATSKKNLIHGIRYLTQMKRYWGMFHHMVENLKTIYKQHADWAAKGRQAKIGGKGDGTIFQYGDWFDTYPHGVSSVTFEDPTSLGAVDEFADAPLYEKPELTSPEDLFRDAANTAVPKARKAARKQSHPSKAGVRAGKPPMKTEPQIAPVPDENQLLRNLSLSPTTSSSNQTLSGPDNNFVTYEPGFYVDNETMPIYPLQNQPLVMAELDRQLVLGAYSQDFSLESPQTQFPIQGIPPPHPPPNLPLSQPQPQPIPHPLTSQPLTQPPPHPATLQPMLWTTAQDYGIAAGPTTQVFQDALGSSAWLMPFNILPPELSSNLSQDFTGAEYTGTEGMDVET